MPVNLGDWPLTIVVMVFAFGMFQLASRSIKGAHDEYSKDLSVQRADHQIALDEQRRVFLETWSNHALAMTRELTRVATITEKMENSLAHHLQSLKTKKVRPKRR